MTSDLTNLLTAKKYDYWLIVWKTNDGGEVHEPINFQTGIHPKEYCEEIIKSEWTTGKGEKLKDHYKSYSLFPLMPCEYPNNKTV